MGAFARESNRYCGECLYGRGKGRKSKRPRFRRASDRNNAESAVSENRDYQYPSTCMTSRATVRTVTTATVAQMRMRVTRPDT